MEGGDLRWFWSKFDMYERIDNVRGAGEEVLNMSLTCISTGI